MQPFRMVGKKFGASLANLFRGMKIRFLAGLLRAVIPAIIASSIAPLVAQPSNTLVVPNANANVEGNVGNNYPLNIGANTTMRYLQVYAASEFGAMPAGGAFITGIAFRRDAGWP